MNDKNVADQVIKILYGGVYLKSVDYAIVQYSVTSFIQYYKSY